MATLKETTQKIIDRKEGEKMEKYEGKDNYGKPKSEYLAKLHSLGVKELGDECENMIWLSAYANNNPRSDFHWQCDACYDECARRHQGHIYTAAHKRASNG